MVTIVQRGTGLCRSGSLNVDEKCCISKIYREEDDIKVTFKSVFGIFE